MSWKIVDHLIKKAKRNLDAASCRRRDAEKRKILAHIMLGPLCLFKKKSQEFFGITRGGCSFRIYSDNFRKKTLAPHFPVQKFFLNSEHGLLQKYHTHVLKSKKRAKKIKGELLTLYSHCHPLKHLRAIPLITRIFPLHSASH